MSEIAPQLLRFTLGLVGNRAAAEEASQDALVALVQRWRRHGPPDSPAAFAFAVARRRAWREVWRQRVLDPLSVLIEPAAQSESRAIDSLDAQRALAGLARLARRDREALLLVAVGDLSMQDAANCCRISISAFKMRLSRARSRLRKLVEDGHART
ncbi:MAG: sigma-70 family RNA polymerase sigma factor [Acidobacteriota bacterium]